MCYQYLASWCLSTSWISQYTTSENTYQAHAGWHNCHTDPELIVQFADAVPQGLELSVPVCSAPRYAELLYIHTGELTKKTPAM